VRLPAIGGQAGLGTSIAVGTKRTGRWLENLPCAWGAMPPVILQTLGAAPRFRLNISSPVGPTAGKRRLAADLETGPNPACKRIPPQQRLRFD